VDLGTGSVKVALVDEAGETLRSASRAYDLSSPHPGWAEADPMEWLHATTAAAGQVLDNGEGAAVVRVGFSGQMHGVVLCDESLDPVRPAITWADSRAATRPPTCRPFSARVLARWFSAVSGRATSFDDRVHEPKPGACSYACNQKIGCVPSRRHGGDRAERRQRNRVGER